MKILLLPTYFTPEIAASLYLFENRIEAFAHAGFKMELHAPVPTRGISENKRKAYIKEKKNESLHNGNLSIHRFFMYREGKNPLLRAFRYFLCSVMHFYKGLITKDIDIIFVSSTPPIQGAMAALLKKVKQVPLIYNLQDIFPDSLVGTGLVKKGSLLWKIGRIIENFTYKNADIIVVISEDFKQNIIAKGVPEKKIEVIYNWVEEDAVVKIDRNDNILIDKYNLPREKFFVTYCGNIGLTQNMDLLLEVAKELESMTDICFILIGEGACTKNVKQHIQNNQIKNIVLFPFQDYKDISYVFSLGNVGMVISKPGVGKNSLPSKTWSIMSAECPVLASFDENGLKQIIKDNNCGIFVNAGDKAALKNAIIYLYNNKEEAQKLGRNGRAYVMKNLTRDIGTDKYVNIIKKFDPLNNNSTAIFHN